MSTENIQLFNVLNEASKRLQDMYSAHYRQLESKANRAQIESRQCEALKLTKQMTDDHVNNSDLLKMSFYLVQVVRELSLSPIASQIQEVHARCLQRARRILDCVNEPAVQAELFSSSLYEFHSLLNSLGHLQSVSLPTMVKGNKQLEDKAFRHIAEFTMMIDSC